MQHLIGVELQYVRFVVVDPANPAHSRLRTNANFRWKTRLTYEMSEHVLIRLMA